MRSQTTLVALTLTIAAACSSATDDAPGGSNWNRPEAPGAVRAAVTERDAHPKVNGQDLTALVEANTSFALDLLGAVSEPGEDKNVFLGPYSISTAMAMLYAGTDGQTKEQLETGMHFGKVADNFHATFNGLDLELLSRNGDVTLAMANQVWSAPDFEVKDGYLDILSREYDAPLALIDFGKADARDTINDWVSDATEGFIEELFPEGTIDDNTMLVLTNAIYLDAPWKYEFSRTYEGEFRGMNGDIFEVEMMSYNEFLPTGFGSDWVGVELPYKGDELSMIVVVPEDIARFEQSLDIAKVDEVLRAMEDGGVHLQMPKFKFSFHTSLKESFSTLGMDDLFDSPDFSAMTSNGGLFVSAIEHEAYIQVDEKGTKAAAATGVAVADSHGPSVSVDRPFLFFIVDRPTSSVLFLGRVVDPRG